MHRVYEGALKLITQMIGSDSTTSNITLDKVGRALFGKHYAGAIPPSKLPPPAAFQILIVNTKDGRGSHWLLRFCDENRGVWYDSFGRDVGTLIDNKYIRENTENDAEQHVLEMNCGQRCLAAAVVGRVLGVEALKKL